MKLFNSSDKFLTLLLFVWCILTSLVIENLKKRIIEIEKFVDAATVKESVTWGTADTTWTFDVTNGTNPLESYVVKPDSVICLDSRIPNDGDILSRFKSVDNPEVDFLIWCDPELIQRKLTDKLK